MSVINIFDVLTPGLIQDIISNISGEKSTRAMYNLTVETRLSVLDLIRLGYEIYRLGVLFYDETYTPSYDYGKLINYRGKVKLKDEKIIQASDSIENDTPALILTNLGKVYELSRSETVSVSGDSTLVKVDEELTISNIETANDIVQISRNEDFEVGGSHSLLLDRNGHVYAFGSSDNGRLGIGIINEPYIDKPYLIDPSYFNNGQSKVVQVSAGWSHSLFLCDDGTVYACGNNIYGQSGIKEELRSDAILVPTPIDTSNMSNSKVIQVSAGGYHSLFLCEDGSAYISGIYYYNNGTAIPTKIDKTNMGKRKIVQLFSGGHHALFICDDGTVYAAGSGDGGVLGNGRIDEHIIDIPIAIDMSHFAGRIVTSASTDMTHSLFLCDDGTVYICGVVYNTFNHELGFKYTVENIEGVPVPVDPATYNNKRITGVVAGWRKSFFLA